MKNISLSLFALAASASLASASIVINFDSNTPPDPSPFGIPSGYNGTVETIDDPRPGPSGNVLYIHDTHNSTTPAVGAYFISNATYQNPTEVIFDFYAIRLTGNTTNVSWWLSSGNATSNRHVGIGYDTGRSSGTEWYIFNGNSQTTLDNQGSGNLLEPNKWLEMRMVPNYGNNTFSLYARLDGNSTWTQLTSNSGAVSTWGFRNNGTVTLNHVWISAAAPGNTTFNGTVGSYTDNIVIIPEPTTVAFLTLAAGAGWFAFRRRRKE